MLQHRRRRIHDASRQQGRSIRTAKRIWLRKRGLARSAFFSAYTGLQAGSCLAGWFAQACFKLMRRQDRTGQPGRADRTGQASLVFIVWAIFLRDPSKIMPRSRLFTYQSEASPSLSSASSTSESIAKSAASSSSEACASVVAPATSETGARYC